MDHAVEDISIEDAQIVASNSGYELVAKIIRGTNAESVHFGLVAVVDSRGRLTHRLGNPDIPFMTRSSIKPFQLLPLVRSGAADHFGFSIKQLAIMCGSHNGTDEHAETALSNLKLAGLTPELLQCGTHRPVFMDLQKLYPLHGEDKDPLRHNCSGKHSGFLALAKFLGDDVNDYLNPKNKAQTLVREAIAEMCEVDPDSMPSGTDGCSAPNYAIPLKNLAIGFMKLATAQGKDAKTVQALTRIRDAMQTYPEMVSGEKRFDLDVMRSFPKHVVCKVGAESVQAFGFSKPGLGVAVKILDGSKRALAPVCVEALLQAGVFDDFAALPLLKPHHNPVVKNYRGILTGSITTSFELHSV